MAIQICRLPGYKCLLIVENKALMAKSMVKKKNPNENQIESFFSASYGCHRDTTAQGGKFSSKKGRLRISSLKPEFVRKYSPGHTT